jgi:hypothetical protein
MHEESIRRDGSHLEIDLNYVMISMRYVISVRSGLLVRGMAIPITAIAHLSRPHYSTVN